MRSAYTGLCLALLLSCLVNAQTKDKTKQITMWDACDPETFNAALGPGSCLPGHHGQILFKDFVGELQADHIAGAWRFNPFLNAAEGGFRLKRLRLESGDKISIQNTGGETHTFTRVQKFGGGFVGFFNSVSGNPVPAPECAIVLPDGSLAPQPESDTNRFVEAGTTEVGPSAGGSALPRGESRWECCVHPWMRMIVVVKEDKDD